jgi:hypothetical protein
MSTAPPNGRNNVGGRVDNAAEQGRQLFKRQTQRLVGPVAIVSCPDGRQRVAQALLGDIGVDAGAR